MERRAHTRRLLNLVSRLELGAGSRPCMIADFSTQGLGLRYSPQTLVDSSSSIVSVNRHGLLAFSDPYEHRSYELRIQIVRVDAGILGALVDQSSPVGLAVLHRLCQEGREAAESQVSPAFGTDWILRQCINCLQQHLSPLFQDFLQELPQALSLAAATVQKEGLRRAYRDALAILETQRETLTWRFRQRLAEPLSRRGPVEPGEAGILAMAAGQSFEGWLALKVMVTKAETQYRAELLTLKMRLDKAGIAGAVSHLNPLGPDLIGSAFQDGLQELGLVPGVEAVCYRLFERQVMRRLGPLYAELNQVLIRHGILPNLDLRRYLTQLPETDPEPPQLEPLVSEVLPGSVPTSTSTESQEVRRSRLQTATAGVKSALRWLTERPRRYPECALGDSGDPSSFRTLGRLLRLVQESAASSDSKAGQPVVYWTLDEVYRALEQMRLQPAKGSLQSRLITCLCAQTSHLQPERELSRLQRESLELVDLFFDRLLQCPWLSPEARGEIRRLDVLVFSRYLRDQWLFEKQKEPLLQLVNALGWLDQRAAFAEMANLQRVQDLLTGLLKSVEPDDEAVEAIVQELQRILDELDQQIGRQRHRYLAAAEGARKVADAHGLVAGELARRTAGKEVPRAIFNLIQGGWRELLVLTCLRQGGESPEWRRHLALLDRLLGEDRDAANIDREQVLEQVRAGLASITCSSQQIEALCRELEIYLAADTEDVVLIRVPEVLTNQAQADTRKNALLGAVWLSRIQKLKVGDWFRWRTTGGDWEYVTLAWIGPGASQFLFVDRQGFKVGDWDTLELVQLLKDATLIPAPDYALPLVSQALDGMVRHVYGRLLQQAGTPSRGQNMQPDLPLARLPAVDQVLLRGQKILPLQSQSRFPAQYHIQFSIYDRRGHWIEPEAYRLALEQNGQGGALDRWVLGRLLEWMAAHPGQLKRIDSLGLSLSKDALNDEGLLEFVYEQLAQSEVPLDKICFDFDEAVALEAPMPLAAFMDELKEYGCRFSLSRPSWDLSGYGLWTQLPLDFIRIDMRQIAQRLQDERTQALLGGMVEMARLARLELVATQVESRASLELLKALRVQYVQGNGVEKPRQLGNL